MNLFGESASEKEDVKIIDQLLRENDRLLGIIETLTGCQKINGLPKLHLVFYQLTNKSISTMSNSATLTDLLKHTFVAQAVDSAGNVYGGTLTFSSVSPSDTTQDAASADPTIANTIDANAVSNTGGTVVNVAGSLSSLGNATPAAGSTAVAVPDGTIIPVSGTLTLVNNVTGTGGGIPSSLSLNFNQAS
jgi:hypothetical protein